MSEYVLLRDHIAIQKGKPPLIAGYFGADAVPYLNPEYLRGNSGAEPAKPGPDAVRAQEGETLLLWDGSNAGEFFRAKHGLVASTMAKITPDSTFKPEFFFHSVKHAEAYLKSQTSGTGIPHVDRELLEGIRAFRPMQNEQIIIAQILDTLDTAIRETEALIDKLKAVKQGLLHDLLTRGIDANGQLRPPQSEAPQLYKKSPLGWIPREWSLCGVLDIAPVDRQCILTGPFGAQLGQADFVAEGVPVLRIGNVQSGYIDWSDLQYVSPEKAAQLERFRVMLGDLLFARQGATTGRNALADEHSNGALINYHIIRVAVDREKCEPMYLYALFNSDHSKGQVDQEKGRGTREGINSKQIASLEFALPPIAEQKALVARMSTLNEAADNESALLAKLKVQKSGLMDDLLTGRVRVAPLLESIQQTAALTGV